MEDSTKIIIDSSQGVVNRLDYDTLGKIRNQTATPQVEMLWRGWFYNIEIYVSKYIYIPEIGYFAVMTENNSRLSSISLIYYKSGRSEIYDVSWKDILHFIITLPLKIGSSVLWSPSTANAPTGPSDCETARAFYIAALYRLQEMMSNGSSIQECINQSRIVELAETNYIWACSGTSFFD